jgi:hypothetical protein
MLRKFLIIRRMIPAAAIVLLPIIPVSAATITWAGHTWNVTTGGLAGGNTGSASNVVVDNNGYLHLKISKNGTAWSCAEIFSTDKMGFGAYRWQVDAPVDKFDKNVVLGLFPYGPEAGVGADGTNEIDIEYSRWGNNAWPDGNYTVYPNSGSTVGETQFNFSLSGGTYTTSSFSWTSTGISFLTQAGFRAAGDTSGKIKSWSYTPANPSVNIPQNPMPLGMNLWLCNGSGNVPSDGNPVEVIIRDFKFIPQGSSIAVSQQGRRSGNTFSLEIFGNSLRVTINNPVAHPLSMNLLDLRGRHVRTETVPAFARQYLLKGIGAGVRVVTIPELGIEGKVAGVR